MGLMKGKDFSYQSTFEDYLAGQAGEGLEGHWTDPNTDILDFHQKAVKAKKFDFPSEYWDRLRAKLTDHVQDKFDTGEGLNNFEMEVADRAGLGDDNENWLKTSQYRLRNSNAALRNDAEKWGKQWEEWGGEGVMRRLFGASFSDVYGGDQ